MHNRQFHFNRILMKRFVWEELQQHCHQLLRVEQALPPTNGIPILQIQIRVEPQLQELPILHTHLRQLRLVQRIII